MAETAVFIGRLTVDLPDSCKIIDDLAAANPRRLDRIMGGTERLIILDSVSFPFEHLDSWKGPLGLGFLTTEDPSLVKEAFDSRLRGLSFFDYVIYEDKDFWEWLRKAYALAAFQGIAAGKHGRTGVVTILENDRLYAVQDQGSEEKYDSRHYWSSRARRLARRAPGHAVCSIRHGIPTNRTMDLVQAGVLVPVIEKLAQRYQSIGRIANVLEIGCGVGRWGRISRIGRIRYSGLDVAEDFITEARRNYPESKFYVLPENLAFPIDNRTQDLVMSITVLHHNDSETKRCLLEEMRRVLRPGGYLILLEDFVAAKQTGRNTVFPMTIGEFIDLIQDVFGGRLLLEQLETVQYSHVDMVRTALLALQML